jgi:predicted DNA-binding protein YlxM (UPF0122 family)
MTKKNIRYIVDFDTIEKKDSIVFGFEVGMSLTNNKELRQALFEKMSSIMTQHNNTEIETAIDSIAYVGLANIGFHVFSTEDFEVLTME